MEYVNGGAVSMLYLATKVPLTEEQQRLIVRETLKGLVYLHSSAIIHRDIKGKQAAARVCSFRCQLPAALAGIIFVAS
jgi:serine/threonine protein kinase